MKLVKERVRRYGLRSQKRISRLMAEKLLRSKGLVLNDTNKNCLFFHANESTKHWLVKAILFKILKEKERTVGTEIEVEGGIVDLIDVDNLIVYEVERKLTEDKKEKRMKELNSVNDVFFINLDKVPNDWGKAERYLKEIVV